MPPPPLVAKVVYFIEGDEEAAEYQSMVIEFNNERWIVATWLQHLATGERWPERVFPLKSVPHVEYDTGLIRLGLLMPRQILEPDAPADLLRKFAATVYPTLDQLSGPSSLQ